MKAKELKKIIKEQIKEVRTSKRFKEFINFCSSIHNYSFYNLMSIYFHKPDASFVNGIKAWNKWGRKIKKGERGIPILAPVIKKVEEVDPITGEVKEVEKLAGFKTVYVWDVSQTEGKPLPINKYAKPLEGETGNYRIIKRFVETRFCPVVEADISCNGMTDFRKIVIKRSLSEVHKLKTLMHELAHFLLHKECSYGKSRKEIEAEISAYLCAKKLGIDTSSYSFDYLAAWDDLSDEEFEKAVDVAVKLADILTETFEKSLRKSA